jgi:chromosome segregation ATPase
MSTFEPQNTDVTRDHGPAKHRNPWIWISALLAVIAIGLLVWGLNTQSDLDSSKDQVEKLEAQISAGRVAGIAAYEDLSKQLNTTSADLADTQSKLEASEKAAAKADDEAAAAKEQAAQADNETDKANAEAAQAKAEADAAQSRASIAVDCARAFVGGVAVLVQSGESSDEAQAAQEDLQAIAETCKTSLGAGT